MENILTKAKSSKSFQILVVFIRYALGTAFVWASILKIKGIRFEPQSGETAPINSISHLLESMYRSGFYWNFIGWGQLLAGFLLMSQIFSTLGAIIYFPIILSIFIITTAFDASFFWILTSFMLFANILLLLWDWNKLKFIILSKPGCYIDQSTSFSKMKIWSVLGILMFLFITIYRVITT